jgi:alpha-N-acetylglucosamine transferase
VRKGICNDYDTFLCESVTMAEKTDWEMKAANLLKAELKRKGVTYAQLVEQLAAIGVDEKEVNVRNKLARGKFTAAFMLQCLAAIGVSHFQVE